MNDPGQRRLWSIPGDGVLARQGNLVLLISIDDRGFAESLLNLLARTNEAGGDGRALADAISAEVERHQSWGEPQPAPALVAFGPAGSGLAFVVSGTAFADFSTSHGTDRLAAGHPSMLLRSVVGVHVQSVRAGLGDGAASDRTDRFTSLDSGTVRASGLSYLSGQAGAPAAPSRSREPGQMPSAPAPGAQAPAAPPPNPPAPAEPPTPPLGSPAHAGPPERTQTPPAAPVSPAAAAGRPGAGGTGPQAAGPAFRPSADPFQTGPRFPADPSAQTGPRFPADPSAQTGPRFPAEPAPAGRPAAAGPPREKFTPPRGEFTPPPVESPYQQEESPEPAALYDLGLEEPGVTGPAPAPATSLSGAVRPAPEPPPVPGHAAGEAGDDGGSPTVLGVYCKNGHFTDPDARACVVCGTGTGIVGIKRRSTAQQLGPRPPLGVLILDDGATLSLDGDYVIGRDPARDQSVQAGEARLLRVVDAEQTVSRVHARIRLAGWQVLLTDLGSANGTRVQQPGDKTEQLLEPQVPVVLQYGARIFVGTPCLRFERSGG